MGSSIHRTERLQEGRINIMMAARIVALIFAFFCLSQSAAWAQTAAQMDQTLDQLYGAHKPYHDFFNALQAAVKADNKTAVSKMISYPLQTMVGGKKVTLHDAAHFVASYDQIITAKVKSAVEHQTYETLFARDQGVMIGDGEVWFSGVGSSNTVLITGINQ
ncbi:hypothetical protein [Aestuariivirga sp.]|uniref:hypothetical protein n=1 Tax=Aestuariivirga sp. TaxID=2650926 RepID=UPI0039E66FE0